MVKPRHGPRVQVSYIKTTAVKCPLCPAHLVVAPGKKPARILAIHMKKKHNATQTQS
jgi:hypothetical protein